MNLVLIGVMGCGKTTIGHMLSKRLKMRFVDMDKEIEKRHGSITGIFEQLGEEGFRDIEQAIAEELGAEDGMVISTGGGIIKRGANVCALKRNGMIFFLDRPSQMILKTLKVSSRPLLRDNPEKLHDILLERYPSYCEACDVHVDASGSFSKTLGQIISQWHLRSDTRSD